MDLILVGYGKMNRLVEQLAAERGHRVVRIIRSPADWSDGWAPGLVAIDFSVPGAVLENLDRLMTAGIPAVIGTTGWYDRLEQARSRVEAADVGAVYGANFSLGVAAFYGIVAAAAAALPPARYDAFIVEAHHRHKRDAPSGTAKRLAAILAEAGHQHTVASVRAGALPGTHRVGFDSEADTVTLTHAARSRRGFAEGALAAAQWILGKRGWHEFAEVREAGGGGKGASK